MQPWFACAELLQSLSNENDVWMGLYQTGGNLTSFWSISQDLSIPFCGIHPKALQNYVAPNQVHAWL